MTIRVALGALLCATALRAQDRTMPPESERQLARAIYKEMIEIKSGYTTGATTPVAEAVAKRLKAAGFPAADIFVGGASPTKANLVVRYRGTGRRRPILLLAHTDVVEAKREDWSMDPFTLTEKDGYFYGRGVGDDKAQAAVWIANLIRYKREGFKPDRDIIVALTADEEGGGPYNGVEWLLKNKRELIDAELCLNEGGWGESVDGTRLVERPPGEREVRHQLSARGAQQGRPQLAARRGQRDLSPRRRARSAVEASAFRSRPTTSRASTSARCRASRRVPISADLAAVAKGDAAAMTRVARAIDVVERDAAHDLRRDAARGRTREERAAAARGGERQLSRAAGRFDRLRDGDAASA